MVNGKLELVFIDKNGKWYPIDEVSRDELAEGLEKISKEIAKRLQLKSKDNRSCTFFSFLGKRGAFAELSFDEGAKARDSFHSQPPIIYM